MTTKKNLTPLRQLNELGYKLNGPANLLRVGGRPYKCYVDRYYHTTINYDGKIYSCTARDFNENNSIGYLDSKTGEIVWEIKKLAKN